jgi:hypothetical protein
VGPTTRRRSDVVATQLDPGMSRYILRGLGQPDHQLGVVPLHPKKSEQNERVYETASVSIPQTKRAEDDAAKTAWIQPIVSLSVDFPK